MKEKEHYMYCIEKLMVISWLFYVLPYFYKKMKEISKLNKRDPQKVSLHIYYLKASKIGLFVSRLTLININVTFEHLDFHQMAVKDINGDVIWWKVFHEDFVKIQTYVKRHPEFKNIVKGSEGKNRIIQFLLRHIMLSNSFKKNKLILDKILFVIRIVFSLNYY